MTNTQPFDADPVDALLSGAADDPAAKFANDLRTAAHSDQPVRIDATLADLFAPPTPQPQRSWRPWLFLRPAATVAAAFVAVIMLGAGAVALVGPQLVETITGGEGSETAIDAGSEPDEIELNRNGSDDVREVVVSDRNDTDTTAADEPSDHADKPDANAVDEEAVLAWVACMEEGFDVWLDGFGTDAGVTESLFQACPADTEGSLGVAGHGYKNATQEWLACASEYGHEFLKAGAETDVDVVGFCGDLPAFSDFGIDVPDDVDTDSDRVEDVQRRGDELLDERSRTGEGHQDGEDDVRNDSSDEGRSPRGRTGEG